MPCVLFISASSGIPIPTVHCAFFSSVFLSSTIYLLVINVWVVHVLRINLVTMNLVMLVNFSVSSTLLILLRTMVKSAFFYLNYNSGGKKTVVLIYGADNNAVLVKQALEASAKTNIAVVGFIEDNGKKIDRANSGR